MLLRAEEEVGVHLSTIPRLSATGTACCPCSIASALVTFVAHVYPEAHFLCLSLLSEYLGKSPGPSVQRWVPSRSTRRDVNTSNEKERHDAIFRKVRGWVSAWQKEGIKDKKKKNRHREYFCKQYLQMLCLCCVLCSCCFSLLSFATWSFVFWGVAHALVVSQLMFSSSSKCQGCANKQLPFVLPVSSGCFPDLTLSFFFCCYYYYFCSILNKLTPEKFDKLCLELLNVGVDSKLVLKGIILLVSLRRAISVHKPGL